MKECLVDWHYYISTFGPTAVALIAAIIVIIGWFVNSYFNRKNEIEKEARNYRIEMCRSIIDLYKYYATNNMNKAELLADDDEFETKFKGTMNQILMYGGTKENVLLKNITNNIVQAVSNIDHKNVEEASAHFLMDQYMEELFNTSVQRFRRELRLEKIDSSKLFEKESKK